MPHAPTRMLIVLPCLLAACSASIADSLTVAPPPASLVAPCALPVALPDRAATQAEVETWWGRDRAALRECGEQQAGLASWAAGVVEAAGAR